MKKAPAKNKNVTMDDLAGMVARGFESVHNEIGEVKDRLGDVEDRLGKVEDRLGKVEDRLGKVEDRLGKVEENLATTRMDVLGIGDRFVSKHEFSQHLIRFSLLEEKVKSKK